MVTNGGPATFTSAATALGALSFQWFFRTNTVVPGATNTWLTFTNAITNLAGFYSVRVTNTFGSTTSSYALLAVSNHLNLLAFSSMPPTLAPPWRSPMSAKSTNRLWASTNLTATNFWQVIATNVMATNGLWFFTDTNTAKTNAARVSTGFPRRELLAEGILNPKPLSPGFCAVVPWLFPDRRKTYSRRWQEDLNYHFVGMPYTFTPLWPLVGGAINLL